MTESRRLVLWNPHLPDHFVVGTNNLRLYRAIKPQQYDTYSRVEHSDDTSIPALDIKAVNAATATANSSVSPSNNATTTTTPALPTTQFDLRDTITYPQQTVNVLQWSTNRSDPLLLAAGLLSGKLALLRFQDDQLQSASSSSADHPLYNSTATQQPTKVIKEFIPRYARLVNAVDFNPYYSNIVAVGLDRVRNGYGTVIWNIETRGITTNTSTPFTTTQQSMYNSSSNASGSNNVNASTFSINVSQATEAVTEPYARTSNSEASVSVSWLPNDGNCLAVGTGFKWLRIYDIRAGGNTRPISVVAHSKSVNGLKFDKAYQKHRLVTYSDDGVVKLWDVRALNRGPVLAFLAAGGDLPRSASTSTLSPAQQPTKLPVTNTLVEVEWCPTVPDLIATVTRDSDTVRFWNVHGHDAALQDNHSQQPKSAADEPVMTYHQKHASLNDTSPPTSIPPTASSSSSEPQSHTLNSNLPVTYHRSPGVVSSVSWHAKHKHRFLTVTTGGLLEDITVRESIPVQISALNHVAVAFGHNLYAGQLVDKTSIVGQTDSSNAFLTDISTIMRTRAELGYSLEIDRTMELLSQYAHTSLFSGNLELQRIWRWLSHIDMLRAEVFTRTGGAPGGSSSNLTGGLHSPKPTNTSSLPLPNAKLPAIYSLLVGSTPPPRQTSQQEEASPNITPIQPVAPPPSSDQVVLQNSRHSPQCFPVYTSAARSAVLRLCSFVPILAREQYYSTLLTDHTTGIIPSNTLHTSNSALFNAKDEAGKSLYSPTNSVGSAGQTVDVNDLELLIRAAEAMHHYDRAAYIAVVHLQLPRAIECLLNASQHYTSVSDNETATNMQLLAMTLQSIARTLETPSNGNTPSLQQADNTKLTSISPFIQAIFTALTANPSAVASNPLEAFGALLFNAVLPINYRVGFACHFLSDERLAQYVKELADISILQGQLHAIPLFCTLRQSTQIANLLQTYVDHTTDLQTTALLSAFITSHTQQYTHMIDPRLNQWILTYRQLLNQWRLWTARAKFDVTLSLLRVSSGSPSPAVQQQQARDKNTANTDTVLNTAPQVTARCNYCGQALNLRSLSTVKSLSRPGVFRSMTGGRLNTLSKQQAPPDSATTRVSGCSACKKSLPRCAICLIPMDNAAPPPQLPALMQRQWSTQYATQPFNRQHSLSHTNTPTTGGSSSNHHVGNTSTRESIHVDSSSMNDLARWWSWCLNCRHGGHSAHLQQWFDGHTTCPVSDCNCSCRLLDGEVQPHNVNNEVIEGLRMVKVQ